MSSSESLNVKLAVKSSKSDSDLAFKGIIIGQNKIYIFFKLEMLESKSYSMPFSGILIFCVL